MVKSLLGIYKAGVHQGSILGALKFWVYISDLKQNRRNVDLFYNETFYSVVHYRNIPSISLNKNFKIEKRFSIKL